ncbi:hypothetical protein, partial [Deinococcus piscis]|uniref:hypothetical protein n=1 Tax=Deinococcus piscis TaxID=394230 RepID=UPI001E4A8025
GQLVEPTGELQYDAIYTRKLLSFVTIVPVTLQTTYPGELGILNLGPPTCRMDATLKLMSATAV